MNENISKQLKIIPELPGCYQYFDAAGEIIYVGKAKNLKRRVQSYFNRKHDSAKLVVMVPQIEKIEFIITDSEIEALILESHLIKKHKPKYNVLLKDDKKFPYFVVTDEEYPRIVVARKSNKNPVKGKYFGPYTDSRAMYSTLELIKKLFPLKQCKTPKFTNRPCLYHSIGRCLAPCQRLITPEEYKKVLESAELFLSGRQGELVEQLKLSMQAFADKHQYEKAARLRDSYFDIQKTMERQKVVSENTSLDQDIIASVEESGILVVTLLKIRTGRLIEKRDFEFNEALNAEENEVLSSFIKQYYEITSKTEIPKSILLAKSLEKDESEVLKSWLKAISGHKVEFSSPTQKRNKEMIELAKKNAGYFLEKLKLERVSKLQNDFNEIGSYIQEKLKLRKFPHTVECFDISHIQGTNTVASMVVFEDGIAKKKKYKKYKIRSQEGKPDDFKSMEEVLRRRYGKIIAQEMEMPDLIIVDGGKGQLSSALRVFRELRIHKQDIVSLAKRLEEVFLPRTTLPILFPSSSSALFFFQRIRDEAHRFAISYHRTLRAKDATKSELDEIIGFGKKSREILLKEHKTIKNISKLTLEELEKSIPKHIARAVFNHFQNKQ